MPTIPVTMPDGTTHLLERVLSQANFKQQKGVGFLSVGLTLTPRATGRSGRNLCPHASPGCAASCFAEFDRMAWKQNKRTAVARTRLLATDPGAFRATLFHELQRAVVEASRQELPLVCRLNVVSDVAFEREFPDLFPAFASVQFMDYTKIVSRVLDTTLPSNYHLTFSRHERNEADCHRVLAAGRNVTVVFRKPPYPETFWGFPVVDGDADDLRFLDPAPCIIALKAKGNGARRDTTGFVLDHPPNRLQLVLVEPPNSLPETVMPSEAIDDEHATVEPHSNGRPIRQSLDPSRPPVEPIRTIIASSAGDGLPPGADPIPPLSAADQRYLTEYHKKSQLVRDRVVGVVRGRATGLYVWGPGGTGKSHLVLSTLREHRANYRLHNSRMDGRGLFTALHRDPDAVHVLEDCEQMMRNRNVRGLLRSALWGQRHGGGPMERTVTWPMGGAKKELRCQFEGGLVVVANLPPADLPEMDAVTTRIPVVHLVPSDPELRAMIRHLARQGYMDASGQQLTPTECLAVAEHLIDHCQGVDRTLDLRLLVNSFEDYRQWDDGETGLHWTDLVATRVRQRPAGIRSPVDVAVAAHTRDAADSRQQADRDVAREIARSTSDLEERLRLWTERTGKSRATFYRRLGELDG